MAPRRTQASRDRKSTRLNSSHPSISYAVFCLKKKKKQHHAFLINTTKTILYNNFGLVSRPSDNDERYHGASSSRVLSYAAFIFSFFFFNDTATTEIYTLSLHDALPIFSRRCTYDIEGLRSVVTIRTASSYSGSCSASSPPLPPSLSPSSPDSPGIGNLGPDSTSSM